MDLLSLTPADSAEMVLRHPITREELRGDDGLPVTFTLHGTDSQAFRAATRSVSNARIARKGKMTAENIEAEGIDVLVGCVAGWSPNFSIGGVKPVFSDVEVRRILDSYLWIKEQIDDFVGRRANFLPRS